MLTAPETNAVWTGKAPVPFEAYALLYGQREGRRSTNFLEAPAEDGPMPLNYYVWVLRSPEQIVLVDTGFSAATAQRRQLALLRNPIDALSVLGIAESAFS